ncbi:hypothetical protein DFQ10_108173 [Winogradskyella eximia]|uniref:RiboL-PSP-HEPN domain-containing protein n=1 Tax=Winogradskyella eximia TaxID=262006 RepID=A0A3D9H1N8_9FLAO|nr:hypothetical protein [Winogradskyella eximia]RED42766.1 hypothetical protein DFQ10_108173 [Winogradskyella eximia]
MKEELYSDLNQNYIDAKEQRTIDLHFAIVSLSQRNFSVCMMIQDQKMQDDSTEEIKNMISTYNESSKELEKNGIDFIKVLFSRSYINSYQIFEEFCYQNLLSLYLKLPTFLKKEEINVTFKDLFMQDDINVIRQNIIEKKIKSIIQGSNIYAIIKKFKTIFGIDINIEKKLIDKLFIISLKRNLLVHNKGIVNSIYLNEIERFNLKSKLILGDYILKDINSFSDLNETNNLIDNIIDSISETMLSDIPRLIKYNDNLK